MFNDKLIYSYENDEAEVQPEMDSTAGAGNVALAAAATSAASAASSMPAWGRSKSILRQFSLISNVGKNLMTKYFRNLFQNGCH